MTHKAYFKVKRVDDKGFLRWLRNRPCTLKHPSCTDDDTYGHHSLLCHHKGVGQKGGDNHAYTVCDPLHREIHAAGNEQTVLDKYGFEGCILEHSEKIYKEYKEMKG